MTKEHPAQRLGMLKRIRKRKLVLLVDVLGEPKRDTGALEQVVRCASLLFGIDNGCRDSTVGVHLQEPFFFLFILLEGDALKVVGKVGVSVLEFFEQDAGLVAVRGTGRQELERGSALLEFRVRCGGHADRSCECAGSAEERARQKGHPGDGIYIYNSGGAPSRQTQRSR